MTAWGHDEEGRLQVEVGSEGGQVWLLFNRSTATVLLSVAEAEIVVAELNAAISAEKGGKT